MTKRIFASLLCLTVFAFAAGCGSEISSEPAPAPSARTTPATTPDPIPAPTPDPVAEQLSALTDEQKVGQLLVVGIEGTIPGSDAQAAIRDYQVGGVILFGRNVQQGNQLAALTNGLKGLNGDYIPLFLCVDEEGGTVSRMPPGVTDLPSAQTFGALEEPEARRDACFELGRVLAAECRTFGLNVDFAPVMDIWSNPENTVIGSRAFGSGAAAVAEAAGQTALGLLEDGVIPVVKHFPGHGDTAVDSHAGLPVVTKTLAELEELELIPFRQAAADPAVPAVMAAHILLTELDPERPASLSPAVITDLLRGELGFQGVVFTDDLTMGAITGTYGIGEAAVMAVEAGCDCLLVCHGADSVRAVREALLAAVEEGRISQARLNESVTRILTLKRDFGLTNEPAESPDITSLNAAIGDLLERLS